VHHPGAAIRRSYPTRADTTSTLTASASRPDTRRWTPAPRHRGVLRRRLVAATRRSADHPNGSAGAKLHKPPRRLRPPTVCHWPLLNSRSRPTPATDPAARPQARRRIPDLPRHQRPQTRLGPAGSLRDPGHLRHLHHAVPTKSTAPPPKPSHSSSPAKNGRRKRRQSRHLRTSTARIR